MKIHTFIRDTKMMEQNEREAIKNRQMLTRPEPVIATEEEERETEEPAETSEAKEKNRKKKNKKDV